MDGNVHGSRNSTSTKKLQASLQLTNESIDIGAQVLESLHGQAETLDTAGSSLESQEYMLARSRRLIRGITWSGWLANLVTKEPDPPRCADHMQPQSRLASQPKRETDQPPDLPHSSFRIIGPASFEAPQSQPPSTRQPKTSAFEREIALQDSLLEQQMRGIATMHEMGKDMSSSITRQSKALDTLADDAELVAEETRALIRMEGRLSSRVAGRLRFLRVVAIEHMGSGCFVECSSDEIALSNSPTLRKTMCWELHVRESGVVAFRSVVSRCWLGQSLFGKIIASSSSSSSWEEWEVNLNKPSPLLACSANSYAGGWIHLRAVPGKGAGVAGAFVLTARSGSLHDKKSAPTWRLQTIGEEKSCCDSFRINQDITSLLHTAPASLSQSRPRSRSGMKL